MSDTATASERGAESVPPAMSRGAVEDRDLIAIARARHILYGVAASLLSPPEEELFFDLQSGGMGVRIEECLDVLGETEGRGELRDAAEEVSQAWEADPDADCEAAMRRYEQIFPHVVPSEYPPYETCYGPGGTFRQAQRLGDVAGFYKAFGLAVSPEAHDRPDHASIELEFAGFLALKEAYALENAESEHLEVVRDATRQFLRDHLGPFVPAFAGMLERQVQDRFHVAAARFASALVRWDCGRLGLPAGADLKVSLVPWNDPMREV